MANGHLDTTQLLISAGADPYGRTLGDSNVSYEPTPLLLAAQAGSSEIVKLLLAEVVTPRKDNAGPVHCNNCFFVSLRCCDCEFRGKGIPGDSYVVEVIYTVEIVSKLTKIVYRCQAIYTLSI